MSTEPQPVHAASVVGRRHRSRDRTELVVTEIGDHAALAALIPEWQALYQQVAGGNPFAGPDWAETWLRHFVRDRELAVLTVRRHGRLIAVAPTFLRRVPGLLRTVQLAGTVRQVGLTELPQVLTAPGEHRSALRAVLRHWCDRPGGWDWLELPMTAGQGWFEPDWLNQSGGPAFLVRHKTVRPAVVLPLPADPTKVRTRLKRNVWESIRRATNRLDQCGQPWAITTHTTPAGLAGALPVLGRLHRARAGAVGRRRHPDQLAAPETVRFLVDVVDQLAARGAVELLVLTVAAVPVAAQLVLRAPGGSYLSLSGLDPSWWQASPVTLLQWAAIERAALRGEPAINLSVGPDVAKLRWSETVVPHPEFVVCAPGSGARLRLMGYSAVAAVAGIRREAARHRVLPGSRGGGR